MEQLSRALYEAGHKSFDLPIERLVVLLRIVLTLFCLVEVATAWGPATTVTEPLMIILAVYATFGVCVAILPTLGKFRTGWQLPVHFFDVGVISVLMNFGHVYSTIFFILYIFALLSATFRWNFPGALWTTVSLLILQLLPPWGNGDTISFILQLSFVAIIGGVFVFFGAWRARSDERLAQIAAWPDTLPQAYSENEDRWLIESIRHVSEVLQVPRVAVLWETVQEPYYFLATFANGKYRKEHVIGESLDDAISAELRDKTFAIEMSDPNHYTTLSGFSHKKKAIFNKAFEERLKIQSVCSSAFGGQLCKGRLFLLDRPNWRDDDLMIAEIVASRLRIELEYHIAWNQLEETTATRERMHLASDLHDGILQSLTAAGMRLKMISSKSKGRTDLELDEVRKLLLDEQHQIRAFVEERQTLRETTNLNLHHQLRRELRKLERQWDCIVLLSVTPEDAKVEQGLVRQIELLLAEAVANAVKHGKAKQVRVALKRTPDALEVHVADNGCGIQGLTGTYRRSELTTLGVVPKSISERVTTLGGDFSLSSSSHGLELHITLPRNERTAVQSDAKAYSVG